MASYLEVAAGAATKVGSAQVGTADTPLGECVVHPFVTPDGKVKPTLVLNPGSRFAFSFGVGKAKLILTYYAEIEQFVKTYGG